jgi:hypothetical protein
LIAASDTPIATIVASDSSASENPLDSGRFTIILNKVVTANTVVNYTVSGTATSGSDFTALSGTITINSGLNSANITLTPINDVLSEGAESVSLTLALNAPYTIGSPSVATVNITDDEIASPMAAYKQSYFGANWNDETIAGDTVDHDSDGLNNMLEYAFGSDPSLDSDTELPQSNTDTGSLRLTFTRVLAHNDITITVQAADDLTGTWTNIASSVNGGITTALIGGVTVSETGSGSTRSVSVTDLYPTNDPTHPRRFMRIRVDQ